MNARWMLLFGIVLASGPMVATGEIYTLTLTGGLPDQRDMELYLDAGDNSIKRAFALAPQFNKVSYTVDASGLAPAQDKLTGSVVVTITSDGYNPPDGCTDVCTYKIEAKVAHGEVAGKFSGTHTRTGTPAPRPRKRKDSPTPAEPQRLNGTLTGTVAPPPTWGRNVRFALYLDNARAQSARRPDGRTKVVPRWNLPGFLRFTTSGGTADIATLRGFGGHPINYFQAEVTKVKLTFSGGRIAGTVDALSDGRTYRFTLDADVIGDRVAGGFTKVVDGKPDVPGRLYGTVEDVSDVAATDAIYYLVLDKAVAARDRKTGAIVEKQMIVHLPCEDGRLSGGVGFAGTYNHTYFDADSAGLKLADLKLTGTLDVTVNPDPYVPPDGKPVPCKYTVDAKVLDGSVVGTFSGTFGSEKVAGRLSGEYRRRPPIPEPMRVNVKLDNGAAGKEGGPAWHRRCYIGFAATGGKATTGSFSNNKGGFQGRLVSADVTCDGETFAATIETDVDESRTVQVGRHTFLLRGKVIGREIVGEVETLFEGRPWKKNTAFMGSLSSYEE